MRKLNKLLLPSRKKHGKALINVSTRSTLLTKENGDLGKCFFLCSKQIFDTSGLSLSISQPVRRVYQRKSSSMNFYQRWPWGVLRNDTKLACSSHLCRGQLFYSVNLNLFTFSRRCRFHLQASLEQGLLIGELKCFEAECTCLMQARIVACLLFRSRVFFEGT